MSSPSEVQVSLVLSYYYLTACIVTDPGVIPRGNLEPPNKKEPVLDKDGNLLCMKVPVEVGRG